jgi:hypothetical protein
MEIEKYCEEAVEESMLYKTQLEELHHIADQIEIKTRHISVEGIEKELSEPVDYKPQLNMDLDEVINRFRRIEKNIKN